MSDDVMIRAEGLGKSYIIGHDTEREPYVALRDVISRGARGLWRKTADLVRGRALVAGDLTEEFWALRDVSFEVKEGEVLGIIGRNGAGKSTLLKVLSRITDPTEGRVIIKGRVASLLEIGTGFHPELTGRENIYLNGAILGMARAEIRKKFDEIVEFAGVERFLDTPVKRYSSGMYVRLAFSVAAHLEPEILVVDEVLAVGDAEFQRKCLGKMRDVACHGRTVLFVSHNLEAIERLCGACVLLEKGRVVRMGPVSSAVQAYLHSSPSLNLDDYRDPKSRNSGELVSVEVAYEPARILLKVRPRSAEPHDFALVIHDHKQNPLFTTHMSDHGTLVATTGDIMLSVPLPIHHLRSGQYFVTFVSFTANSATFFDVVMHIPVEIVSIDRLIADEGRWGQLCFDIAWVVNEVPMNCCTDTATTSGVAASRSATVHAS
jgi:ABC-type polysaccharide/polyol phosphate transport system ATPase subunit